MARDHEAADARIRDEVVHHSLERAPGVVATAHTELQGVVPRRPRCGCESRFDCGPLLRVQELGERRADQLLCLEAEHRLDRRGEVRERAVVIENGDQVGGVLDERAEAGLAASGRLLLDELNALDGARDLGREPLEAADGVRCESARGHRDLADPPAVAAADRKPPPFERDHR